MLNKSRVAVLLSLYNGERYLPELLSSLTLQRDIEIFLYVRDDGSTADSLNIMKKSLAQYGDFTWLPSEAGNIGPALSYHNLLQFAVQDGRADYFAFCDQDDIWSPEKLLRATSLLRAQAENKSIMYFSGVNLFASSVESARKLSSRKFSVGFRNALVENLAIGATIVLNKNAASNLSSEKVCTSVGHDAWYYLVVSYIGITVYDENSEIFYRRHNENHTNFSKGSFTKIRIYRFLKTRNLHFFNQALCLRNTSFYSMGSVENREILDKHIASLQGNVFPRSLFILKGGMRRSSHLDSIFLAMLSLSNRKKYLSDSSDL